MTKDELIAKMTELSSKLRKKEREVKEISERNIKREVKEISERTVKREVKEISERNKGYVMEHKSKLDNAKRLHKTRREKKSLWSSMTTAMSSSLGMLKSNDTMSTASVSLEKK